MIPFVLHLFVALGSRRSSRRRYAAPLPKIVAILVDADRRRGLLSVANLDRLTSVQTTHHQRERLSKSGLHHSSPRSRHHSARSSRHQAGQPAHGVHRHPSEHRQRVSSQHHEHSARAALAGDARLDLRHVPAHRLDGPEPRAVRLLGRRGGQGHRPICSPRPGSPRSRACWSVPCSTSSAWSWRSSSVCSRSC